jgi:hypothetical protein
MCFSWYYKEEQEQEYECGAFLSTYKKAGSNKYPKIKGVTKDNVNKCIVNELKYCIKKSKS